MEINLKIGWNDLSDSCREKIKQIHKLMKSEKSKVNVEYPNIKDILNKCANNNTYESYFYREPDNSISVSRDSGTTSTRIFRATESSDDLDSSISSAPTGH